MREELLLDVPHRQVVFTIPRMLRIFFKYNRRLLGSLCRCALQSMILYFAAAMGSELMPGVILRIIREELRPIPSGGWAEMIRKVYDVDPMVCPQCGGQMKVISFLTDYAVVDRIIDHLKLTFVAERPPPAHLAYQEVLMAAETPAEYSS